MSVAIETRWHSAVNKLIERMTREVVHEIMLTFRQPEYGYAQDASIASATRILLNKMQQKYDKLFADAAPKIAETMVDQVDNNSGATLSESVKDMTGGFALSTDILTGDLDEVIKSSVSMNVALIKSVPITYLKDVYGETLRAIQSGRGIADLQPALEAYGVQRTNWAKNTAMDQVRKAYSGITRERMLAIGLTEYEWEHSGGSWHPRIYHRDVLAGQIFSFDDPPIIDERTGERGNPGDAIHCRCRMRPVFRNYKEKQ